MVAARPMTVIVRRDGARRAGRLTETFVGALARHARERPDALALVDDRARLTWREAPVRVESAAGWLGARVPRGAATLLSTHPAVHEVAVVGAADPVLGERVCACVVPRAGAAPTLEALRDHARAARIAHYKLPERLLVVPELPRAGDKLDRRALAALAAANSDVAATADAGHPPRPAPAGR